MMSVTISRSDLLNAFEKLQSQFNHALSDAQAKDQEFEELRGRFRQNLERRLKDAEKYLQQAFPVLWLEDQMVYDKKKEYLKKKFGI